MGIGVANNLEKEVLRLSTLHISLTITRVNLVGPVIPYFKLCIGDNTTIVIILVIVVVSLRGALIKVFLVKAVIPN